MGPPNRVPDLKELLGAMVFGANRPLTVREMRKCLQEVAGSVGEHTTVYADAKDGDIRRALDELAKELEARRCGFLLQEISSGFRLQSDESCGVWLKQLLKMRPANRLSRPALETLAIIAYRQPLSRAEIEAIRGVNIDHVIKVLMEMQLVRIVGRSELPGRPFLYGTTQAFLDHFGLKNLDDLSSVMGLGLASSQAAGSAAPAPAADGDADEGGDDEDDDESDFDGEAEHDDEGATDDEDRGGSVAANDGISRPAPTTDSGDGESGDDTGDAEKAN